MWKGRGLHDVPCHCPQWILVSYALYTEGQEIEHTRRLSLMGDLHRAIGCSELHLYCQPKVDMRSRRVCGAEALVRWCAGSIRGTG
ncbi:hypothetical protein [Massilia polaris]|uniref:hypothetical protein n=1 Tax=Massilia polaris TaxID=2728846 RepID=UPI001E64EE23|nr:hypothetical protein [Massilia polaris]